MIDRETDESCVHKSSKRKADEDRAGKKKDKLDEYNNEDGGSEAFKEIFSGNQRSKAYENDGRAEMRGKESL